MIIEKFICLQDNYSFLIHDQQTNTTAVVDAPETQPILTKLKNENWSLDYILVTHNHPDHTDAIKDLKNHFKNAKVIISAKEQNNFSQATDFVNDGDQIYIGEIQVITIATPGHTNGHMIYWLPKEKIVFTGDILFSMGCGKIFEANPEIMYNSLVKVSNLPPETKVYCGHEYSFKNSLFALMVDENNQQLKFHSEKVKELTKNNYMTIPTTINLEKNINPFLRTDSQNIKKYLNMENSTNLDVFTELRKRKDNF